MGRRFGMAMLFAAGLVLGCALGSYQNVSTAKAQDDEVSANTDIKSQLKDLNERVKSIDTILHTGTLRVAVVISQ
jgi:hypothetical protein